MINEKEEIREKKIHVFDGVTIEELTRVYYLSARYPWHFLENNTRRLTG